MIYNLTKKNILSENPFYAYNFFIRARGLIGRKFDGFDAMVFEHCSSIHTFFMSFKIDVVFTDGEGKVRAVRESLAPWCPYTGTRGASTVIELPEGAVKKHGVEINDLLNLKAELTESELMNLQKKIISAPDPAVSNFSENKQ